MKRLLIAALTLTASVFAQTFEVATIKKADDPQPGKPVFFGRRGGPGSDDSIFSSKDEPELRREGR